MSGLLVPWELQDRLGHEGSLDLLKLLDSLNKDWSDAVLSLAIERFERRLAEEISKLRSEFHQDLAGVRQEVATTRVELLKWSFVFWIGQVAAMAGLMAFMFTALRHTP
jgi:hypothetical protein